MQDMVFATARLTIRPWTDADAEWYVNARDEDIVRWTRESEPLTPEGWMRERVRIAANDGAHRGAIVDDAGVPVGNIGARSGIEDVELFYWIESSARGNGYATEALAGAVDWFREHHSVDVFTLEIHPQNAASIAVAERAGFSFAGLRESCDSCADEDGNVAVYLRSV
jgi:RimJ/RimL family protein N-acetyltransferase